MKKSFKEIIFGISLAVLVGVVALSVKVLLIVIGIVLLISSSFLLYKGVGKINFPTFPLVYFIFFILFIYLGSFQIFFKNNMDNPKYIIATNLGLLLFPLGVLCANFFLKYQPRKEILAYKEKSVQKPPYDFKNIVLFVILAVIAIFISLIYLQKIPEIPLITALQEPGEQLEISKAREAATALFTGKLHRYRFFFDTLLPLLSIISLVKAKVTSYYKRLWWAISIILILFTSFMLLVNMVKALVLIYTISLFLAFFIATRKKIRLKNVILFGILALIFLGIIYSLWAELAKKGETTGEKLSSLYLPIYNRTVLGQTKVLDWYFRIFPQEHNFLLGKSFPNPGGFLPHESFSLSRYVYDFVHPDSPIVGSMPTVFFGEIYANFGYAIMLFSIFLMGIILQSAQVYFIRRPKTVLMVSFMVFLMIYAIHLTITSFFQVFSIPLLILIIIIILFRIRIIPATENKQHEA